MLRGSSFLVVSGILLTTLWGCDADAPLDDEPGGVSEDDVRSQPGPCGRDWRRAPAIARLEGQHELFALSDVHGDLAALQTLLHQAGLLEQTPVAPEQARWSGGPRSLVVVGDLIDKGPDSVEVLQMMRALTASAQRAGGHVVVTMGNHEAEFLADPHNDKASKADGIGPELEALGLSLEATADGDNELGRYLCDLPLAAKVDNWFFAHAGNTRGKKLDKLDTELMRGISAQGFASKLLLGDDGLLEARLSSKKGKQWWDADGDAKQTFKDWTRALGVDHIVMGHQPGKVAFANGDVRARGEAFEKYGARLFLIDTGMSVGADGSGGAMLHVRDVAGPQESWRMLHPDGSEHEL